MPSEETIEGAKRSPRGSLTQPNDAGYDAARNVDNAVIWRRPALIVQCVDVAEVLAAVNFGPEAGLTTAIRGGGHSGPGLGTVGDGPVIDLRQMRGTWVGPTSSALRAHGGCVWGDVDHATSPFGQAVPSGFVPTTGVGGLSRQLRPPGRRQKKKTN